MMDWYLSITSWRGVTAGASHFYGRIYSDPTEIDEGRVSVEVNRTLTSEQARDLAVPEWMIEKGPTQTIRFDDRGELIDRAVEIWHKHAGPGDRLLLGNPVFDDREVLAKQGRNSDE